MQLKSKFQGPHKKWRLYKVEAGTAFKAYN